MSTDAQIYRALPVPDGSVWIVAQGPYDPSSDDWRLADPMPRPVEAGGQPSTRHYNQLDLYGADGRHLSSARILATQPGPLDFPIAAAADMLVVLGWLGYGTPQTELIRFGTVSDKAFHQSRSVEFRAPFRRIVPVLAADRKLFLIDKVAGNILAIDPQSGSRQLLRPSRPHPVQAAAADSDFLYLLSADQVLKTNLAGTVLATYRLRFDRGFRPTTLGAAGDDLYLMDDAGRVEEFRTQ